MARGLGIGRTRHHLLEEWVAGDAWFKQRAQTEAENRHVAHEPFPVSLDEGFLFLLCRVRDLAIAELQERLELDLIELQPAQLCGGQVVEQTDEHELPVGPVECEHLAQLADQVVGPKDRGAKLVEEVTGTCAQVLPRLRPRIPEVHQALFGSLR